MFGHIGLRKTQKALGRREAPGADFHQIDLAPVDEVVELGAANAAEKLAGFRNWMQKAVHVVLLRLRPCSAGLRRTYRFAGQMEVRTSSNELLRTGSN